MKKVFGKICSAVVIMFVGLFLFGEIKDAEAATAGTEFKNLSKEQKKNLKNKIDNMIADYYSYNQDPEGWWFHSVYIDNDDVPEIHFTKEYYEGILYFSGNSVKEFSTDYKFAYLDFIPRSGLFLYEEYPTRFDEGTIIIHSFPDFEIKTEKDYENALKKYGDDSQREWITYYDLMYYLGYPEAAYEAYIKEDLDGDGKKETIGIRAECNNIEPGYTPYGDKRSKLFINNKVKYTAYGNLADEGGVSISVIDIDPTDKYKEISVLYFDPHGGDEYIVLRYKNKKLKALFYCEGYELNNNGTLFLSKITSSRLGNLYIKTAYKIKKDKLVEVKKKGDFDLFYSDGWSFTANEKIKLFEKPDGKKTIKTIYAGERFTALKLRKLYNKETKEYTWQYAYVVTENGGNKGWINIEGWASKSDDSENMVTNPGWPD